MKKSLFLGMLLVATASSGQPQSANAGSAGAYNPNETVCRMIGETGSRLNRSRVCMTRAEWEQYRRDMRQNIDHAQTSRVNPSQ
jgi:hypothetical protein